MAADRELTRLSDTHSAPTIRGASSFNSTPAAVFHSARDLQIQRSGALSPGRSKPTSRSAAFTAAFDSSHVDLALQASRSSREELVRSLGEQLLLLDRLFTLAEDKVRARGLLIQCTKAAKALLGTTQSLEAVALRSRTAHEATTREAEHARTQLEAELRQARATRAAESQQAAEALRAAQAAANAQASNLQEQLMAAREELTQSEARRKREAEEAKGAHTDELRKTKQELDVKRRAELDALRREKAASEAALQVTADRLQLTNNRLQV